MSVVSSGSMLSVCPNTVTQHRSAVNQGVIVKFYVQDPLQEKKVKKFVDNLSGDLV